LRAGNASSFIGYGRPSLFIAGPQTDEKFVTLILLVSGISNVGAVGEAVPDPIDVLILKSEKQARIAAQFSPVVC